MTSSLIISVVKTMHVLLTEASSDANLAYSSGLLQAAAKRTALMMIAAGGRHLDSWLQ
jgi:hypothetical protein